MSAVISGCGQYRYHLRRVLSAGSRLMLWLMLNPSTADAHYDDATIRRVKWFSHHFGYDVADVVNLYALRSTNPDDLWTGTEGRAIGAGNDRAILEAAMRADIVVCGWGAEPKAAQRARDVYRLVREGTVHRELWCLGHSKDGSPRHPLYMPKSSPLTLWGPGQ